MDTNRIQKLEEKVNTIKEEIKDACKKIDILVEKLMEVAEEL
jgi:peptidoglycan hydrolase CwlO-like protein